MRVVVQRTFVEVVEEDSDQLLGMAVKRALSAPVAPSRGCEPSPSKQESREAEGQEPRTTVSIRDIPPHLTRDQLLHHLDAWGFAGLYDFVYLPVDFAKCQNFGYAFVNLSRPEHAQRILAVDGHSWGQPSEGRAVVSWSLTQGLDLHIERYRNSPVMHESMKDECKPIVLEGGVRVDFPPPTKALQRVRRLRTRCGSRGRAARGGIPSMKADHAGDAPGTPAGPCMLLPGLSSAPSGASKETDAILASPLLAGLTRTNTKAFPAAPDWQQLEALSESSTTAKASPLKRTAWADLEDDECSECSTQAPGYCSSTLSSDGSSWASDGLVARRRSSGSSAESWSGSMLAQGLMPALP
jgi:hypothetical protein